MDLTIYNVIIIRCLCIIIFKSLLVHVREIVVLLALVLLILLLVILYLI